MVEYTSENTTFHKVALDSVDVHTLSRIGNAIEFPLKNGDILHLVRK